MKKQLFLIGILAVLALALEAIFNQPQPEPTYNETVPINTEAYPSPYPVPIFDPYPYPVPAPTGIVSSTAIPLDILPTLAPPPTEVP